MTWKAVGLTTLALGMASLLAACSDDAPPASSAPESAATVPVESSELQLAVNRETTAVCDSVNALAKASNAFLEKPKQDSLTAIRGTWKKAHATYQTLAFIYQWADQTMPQVKNDRDPIDAHPLLPGYLDQVPGYPASGLAFSEVPLTPDFLRKEHQSTDFYYLTLGFHPMEALLWPADSQSAAETLAYFKVDASIPEDKINVPQRRRDLLRLMATGLKRDVQPLCDTRNNAYLIAGLAPLEPAAAAAQLEKSLTTTLGESLEQWEKQPEGEDRNGMPIAHSPQALTDLQEWANVSRSLASNWLAVLLETDGEEAENGLGQQLRTLADQLDAIDLAQKPVDIAALKTARQTLNQISESLTQKALHSSGTP